MIPLRKKRSYRIIHGHELTLDQVQEIIALDKMALDMCYQVTAEDDYELFRNNPESGIAAIDEETGRIAGYSMLLPMPEATYNMIKEGHFNDRNLRPDMLAKLEKPGIYWLYFASVVVHPDHRSARMVVTLLDAMVRDFVKLTERGIYMNSLLADVVSPEGIKFCRLFGLEKIMDTDHGSQLFEVSGLPPMLRITSPATQQLYDIYSAKFKDEYAESDRFLGEKYFDGLDEEESKK